MYDEVGDLYSELDRPSEFALLLVCVLILFVFFFSFFKNYSIFLSMLL